MEKRVKTLLFRGTKGAWGSYLNSDLMVPLPEEPQQY